MLSSPTSTPGRAERTATSLLQTVGWLHDVVEDTDVTPEEVRRDLGDVVAEAVDAITHREGEARDAYYARVKANPVALAVKEADLGTNTDPWRTRMLEPAQRARLGRKYAHAYEVLGLTPPAPLVPDDRIVVSVGDFARRGHDEVIVAWVGQTTEDVTAVFTRSLDGQFRGTAAVPGLVQHHGIIDDVRVHSLPGDWTVTDPQWGV